MWQARACTSRDRQGCATSDGTRRSDYAPPSTAAMMRASLLCTHPNPDQGAPACLQRPRDGVAALLPMTVLSGKSIMSRCGSADARGARP
jgi:hypothetical protein